MAFHIRRSPHVAVVRRSGMTNVTQISQADERWKSAYFYWLVEQTHTGGHQEHTYNDVLSLLYQKEFVWLVANDDNRMEDGRDLRGEFLREANAPIRITIGHFGYISVLEVLVALSRRLSFVAGEQAEGWAWQLMENLDLHRMSDPLSNRKAKKADEILERLVWRTYDADGQGGFFPLQNSERDQTKVEIWYQMQAYVGEIHPEY